MADLYVDEKLSDNDHTTRHNALIGERHRLQEQLDALQDNQSSRLEQVKKLILDSKKAGFLTEHGSPEEKRDLFKKTGSNLQLLNRQLRWEPRGAWQLIHETLADQGCFAHQHTTAAGAAAVVRAGETNLPLKFPLKCG